MNEHDATEIAFKNGYKQGKADAVGKLCNRAIDNSVIKDNGDGTERLFISIAQLREITKEILEETK